MECEPVASGLASPDCERVVAVSGGMAHPGRFAWRLDVVAPALVVSAGERDKLLSASA